MTKNQASVLNFIERHVRENGYSPSFSEITSSTGVAESSLQYILAALDAKGHIVYRRGRARGIMLPKRRLHSLVSLKEMAREELAESGMSMEQELMKCLLSIIENAGVAHGAMNEFFFEGRPMPRLTGEIMRSLKDMAKLALLTDDTIDIFIGGDLSDEDEGAEPQKEAV